MPLVEPKLDFALCSTSKTVTPPLAFITARREPSGLSRIVTLPVDSNRASSPQLRFPAENPVALCVGSNHTPLIGDDEQAGEPKTTQVRKRQPDPLLAGPDIMYS